MNFFDKLTKNPNLNKNFFLVEGRGGLLGGGRLGGGGVWGWERGLVEVHEQIFQMALSLFKEKKVPNYSEIHA